MKMVREDPRTRAARSVLVVDDDDEVRDAMTLALELAGYSVAAVEDGASALTWLAVHPAPHLIVLDLMMPQIDGWVLLKALRANPARADIPVVLCTAAAIRPPLAHPALSLVHKPIDARTLVAAVEHHLGAPAAD